MRLIDILIQGISNYPVSDAILNGTALIRGVNLNNEATAQSLTSEAYRLVEADIKSWVADAPNVNQGGTAFDLLVNVRESLRLQANATYKEFNDPRYIAEKPKVTYGYKGSSL